MQERRRATAPTKFSTKFRFKKKKVLNEDDENQRRRRTSITYVLRSGRSLLTQRRRQDLPVRGRRPLDRMELHSRGPCSRTCRRSTSSSSAFHGPFLTAGCSPPPPRPPRSFILAPPPPAATTMPVPSGGGALARSPSSPCPVLSRSCRVRMGTKAQGRCHERPLARRFRE